MQTIEFIIPDWVICAIVNGDPIFDEQDEIKLNNFTDYLVKNYGHANLSLGDIDGADNLGFMPYNSIDNLGCDCYRMYLIL